jgi:hypothetical protein
MPGRDGPDIILGGELAGWLEGEGDGDQARELIIEARTPPRVVRLEGSRAAGKAVPGDVESTGPADRARIISELNRELSRIVDGPTTVLKAAGAVVIRADRDQLRKILELPQVKAVRPNRSLKRPG